MREKGTGTKYPGVYLLANGQYRVRARWIDARTGVRKEVDKIVSAASARDAESIRVGLIEKTESGVVVGRVRVGDFSKSWIKLKAPNVASYTLRGYAYALEKHILPELGDFYYDALTPADVQAVVNRLLEKHAVDGSKYTVESVRDWYRVFRNMTHDAIAQLGLPRNPTMRIHFPEDALGEEESREYVTLTPEELPRLLAAMRPKRPTSWALTATLAYTGLRFCHASALQWGDIDWDRQIIFIRRKQVKGIVGAVSRKKRAPSEMPLLPELAEVLKTHRAYLERLKYQVGEGDWVFPSRAEKLRTPASLMNALKYSLAEAGIPKKIGPHKLRYLFNDALRLAGVDPVTGKALTGHVTNKMRERYSTVRIDEKRDALAAVARVLAAKPEKPGPAPLPAVEQPVVDERETDSRRERGTRWGTVLEFRRRG